MAITLLKQLLTEPDDLLEQIKSIDGRKCNYKTENISMIFQKPARETNSHVRFVYALQKIWNHTQRQVSV